MNSIESRADRSKAAKWTDVALIVSLFLLALVAPHSIAARMNRRLSTTNENSYANDGPNLRFFSFGLWIERGLVLGAIGGLVGFFTSGLVHYNWGDSEVVMFLYFIMGLTLALNRSHEGNSDQGSRA